MVWLFLILAIVLEVGAALSLRLATGGRKLFYIAVVVGYLGAFFFLTQVLALGLGIGVAYGIWAASGVALTAVASKFLFKESLHLGHGARHRPHHRRRRIVELGAAH